MEGTRAVQISVLHQLAHRYTMEFGEMLSSVATEAIAIALDHIRTHLEG
jgi:hypothetical protein